MTKVAVFIDGGHLRACAKSAKKPYTPELVVKVAKTCVQSAETLFRILYYDCEEFAGSVKLPVSGGMKSYPGGNPFLSDLAREELVAVRRGILKFRGWERRASSLKPGAPSVALTDADFQAKWEQKGVDLRIGLDIVTMTESRAADLIVLLTGDTDLIPAMKLARGRGLQLAGLDLPNRKIIPELKPHLDFFRQLATWP
jgi:uncharacterized LabA/DUF88 family protein